MPSITETGRSVFFSRTIEITANIATVVVACLLSAVLVKNYLLPTSSARPVQARSASVRPADAVTVGTELSKRLPVVNWNRSGRTLVLVLSTHCHFCTESAPFFRVIRDKVGKDVKLVGILPQSVAESQAYLNQEGVHLDEVQQISLDKVGVAGTPTMLLVNRDGAVTQSWVGKLQPDKQEQVLKIIGAASVKKGGSAL